MTFYHTSGSHDRSGLGWCRVRRRGPMGALMRGRRSATLAAALLLLTECVSAAPPSVDRSHAFMEPAQPKPRSPRLKSPYGGGTDGHSGVMVSLSRLVTPQRTLIMLPAVWAAMVMLRPDLLARLLLQVTDSLFQLLAVRARRVTCGPVTYMR